MHDAIYLVTIVKFGLTGLSTYFSLKGIHKNLKEEWALLLATSFSLMSFSTSQLEINNWLDVFILLPLVLLGLHRLLKKRVDSLLHNINMLVYPKLLLRLYGGYFSNIMDIGSIIMDR